MKVALVHDYLREYGGAERVLEALHEIFPEAPVFTAYRDLNSLGEHRQRLKSWHIKTSWLQIIPFASSMISPLRILAVKMFESFNFSGFDLVISSCNTYFSKAIKTSPKTLHISYIHTPPRYLYGYTTSFNYKKNIITRVLGEVANHFLRVTDFKTSQRPDILVANSNNVKKRISKFYRREAVVIYPPVDVEELKEKSQEFKKKKDYFLVVSRLVRGKGVDTVVDVCSKLGLPLKVVGAGPQLESLKQNAGKSIEFLGQVEDNQLPKLYTEAKALVIASEDEDFGITAVEAQACGTPVIAPASGGFLETVVDKKTGLLYGEPGMVNAVELASALEKFNSAKFNPEDCRKNAEKFSKERFKKEILELVKKNIKS